ncbi:MAG TPA: DUF4339 domain-containing protein, partial [Chthoniobacteraceae bacterium]|nr:DUF4339 domain-containing protein [Chthoniobacteraceae bacterium]
MKVQILKDGREMGPFDEQVVIAMLDAGELSDSDLAMTDGLADWTPLGEIVVREKTFPNRLAALGESCELTVARVRRGYATHPFTVGVSALLIGCMVMFLSRWPITLYGPFILAALAAAVVMIGRSRALAGIFLLIAGSLCPLF